MPRKFDPQEMALRGRIGGYVTHSRYDSRKVTAPARKAFLERFLFEVDPNSELSESERVRRAELARRAYFAKLAHASAKARRAKNSRG